jgi:carboxypeptidase Taq
MQPQAAYDELIRRTREESLLASCAELLGWDELTYMPPRGVAHRGNQLALLSGLLHEKGTDPRIGELLDVLEQSDLVRDAEAPAAVNVREIRRVYNRAVRLPRALVEELARVTSFAQQEWAVARAQSNFEHFRPWLEKVVALKRDQAQALGSSSVAYDALLDEYEPGAHSDDLRRLFEALRRDLVPLVAAIGNSRRRPDTAILQREFPVDRQRRFGEEVAAALGFDFTRGRLDTTVHPFFSTIGPGDCRIVTRFGPRSFCDGFFGILHELGHALYEQGLDPAHHGTPLGEAVSLGLHESQSRLWENIVGRSRAFWEHFFSRAREVFPDTLADVCLDDFHFAVNAVAPSLNRVQADEVTYNLHILVRFELEQALLTGDLPAADVPAAWSEAYRRHLGIAPANDTEGCLQDGHWGAGLIGYFPTYTLGNVFAAQLFARATEEVGEMGERFRSGGFATLLDWLRANVYRHGSRYPAVRLIERVTGTPVDHRPLVQALWRKYGELYGL